jgi:type I restriction enzyme S subunit
MLMDGARSSVVFNGQKGVVSSTFAVIRTDAKYRYLLHEYFKGNIEAMVANNTGSAIPHANKKFIVRMCIKLPMKGALVDTFNNRYQDIFSQIQNFKNKLKLLTHSRDRLLSRLMSGKIDVERLDIKFPASMMEEGGVGMG